MATFSHGTSARIWLDGFPAACYSNDVSAESEIDTAEVTTLCATAKSYIPGLEDGTVSVSGFYDTDTVDPELTFEHLLSTRKRTVFPVTYAPHGANALLGDACYMINGLMTSFNIGSTVDEAVSVETEFQSSTGLMRGQFLVLPGTVLDDDADGADLDNTTATTNGYAAILSVEGVSGTTPTLDLLIEHSANGTDWATLVEFDQANAQKAYFVKGTGSVSRHVRASWVTAGTTPAVTAHVAFHRF